LDTKLRNKPKDYVPISGERHREFRRAMAGAARVMRAEQDGKPIRPPESITRSLTFPLDGDISALRFDSFAADYHATDGIGDGSLFALWLAVWAGGFGLFGNASLARQAQLDGLYQRYDTAVADFMDGRWPVLTFRALVARLTAKPRTTGGKSIAFVPDLVGKEFAKSLYGTSSMERVDAGEQDLLTSLVAALCEHYDSWDAALQDVGATLDVVRGWMRRAVGPDAPDLGRMYRELPAQPEGLEGMSLAYLGESVLAGDDSLLPHRAVSLVLNRLQREGLDFGAAAGKASTTMVTQNSNALSWLFGSGWQYLRTVSVDKAAEVFGIEDRNHLGLSRLLRAAQTIAPPKLFGRDNYSEYRSLIGGKIASWVSNYLNRVNEWRDALDSMPDQPFTLPAALAHGETAAYLFRGMDVDYDGLSHYLAQLHGMIATVNEALDGICGRTHVATEADFQTLQRFIELQEIVSGRLNMLSNRISQERRLAEQVKDAARLAYIDGCRFAGDQSGEEEDGNTTSRLPAWMTPLPIIPKISGGVPDVTDELVEIQESFNHLRTAAREHMAGIASWLATNGHAFDPVRALEAREIEHLSRATGRSVDEAVERANRLIISRFMKQVRLCADEVRRPIVTALIATGVIEARWLNQFMFNEMGVLWRSVFSRSNHEAYPMSADELRGQDWLAWIDEQVANTWAAAEKSPTRKMVAAALQLERSAVAIRMAGLPDVAYPATLASTAVNTPLVVLAPMVRLQLHAETIRAETLAKVTNSYANALTSAARYLLRPEFILKTRFQRVGDNELVYVPRARAWTPPAPWRYTSCEAPVRRVLESGALTMDEAGVIDPVRSLHGVLGSAPDRGVTDYLRQAPHEWHWHIGMGAGKPVTGLAVSKDWKKLARKAPSKKQTLRLVGPRQYKSMLDKGLLPDDRVEWGDITLIATQLWDQALAFVDGQCKLTATPRKMELCIVVPVQETPEPVTEVPRIVEGFVDRAVAIDLGECTVAYTVFDCATGKAITDAGGQLVRGHVKVPQIRALMRIVNRYRNSAVPRQKFAAKFDRRLEKTRETVTGAVVRVINDLCARYRAFPILESTVGNFERGEAQLRLIYQSVLKHYLYSSVQEQQRYRERFWYGAGSWRHPYLQVEKRKPGAKGTRVVVEPLILFQGAGVAPHGTSQRCSCCGRNPYTLLDDIKGKVHVEQGGVVNLADNQRLRLDQRSAKGEFRPLAPQSLSVAELRSAIAKSLRRPQPKAFGKPQTDTTQSHYQCVFADCGHSMHADENASTNIGEKFFTNRVRRST